MIEATAVHATSMALGVFTDRSEAEAAILDLESHGYTSKDISIVMKDKVEAHHLATTTGSNIADGAASGASTGAVVGAIAGLLVGVGAIALPGIGALLIGGPIAAALGLTGAAATTATGAMTGAVAGGLVGALIGLGLPEVDAQYYQDRVKAGAILLAVPITRSDQSEETRIILENHGADQIRTVSSS